MVVLDLSVIITALPKIHQALHFSAAGLSWVQSAYALTFGGLLLLGARAGDILGRRRVFVAGIGLFSVTSLLGGLAQSAEWLLAARALQGVAAAIAAPSTLALLTSSFPEGPERTRAVAAYAAVAGGGGSVGLVLGGMLTQWISWRWGLFINVPVGLVLMWLAPRYLSETERHPGRFDLLGAATSTFGMTALVYGFVRAAANGWGDAVTVASFVTSVVLLVAFVAVERRAEQPITPLRLFASRERSGAYLARLLVVGAMLSMFFFVTQYLQGARNFTALEAGLAFLPMTLVMFTMVRLVPRLVARVGNTRLLIAGLIIALAGMAWMSRLSIDSAYFPADRGAAGPARARDGDGVHAADHRGHRRRGPRRRRRRLRADQRRPATRRLARPQRAGHGVRRGDALVAGPPAGPGIRCRRGPRRARPRGGQLGDRIRGAADPGPADVRGHGAAGAAPRLRGSGRGGVTRRSGSGCT